MTAVRITPDVGTGPSGLVRIFQIFPVSDHWVDDGICVAYFDCEIPGVTMTGCRLMRYSKRYVALPPLGKAERARGRSIRLHDNTLLPELAEVACKILRAGGRIDN